MIENVLEKRYKLLSLKCKIQYKKNKEKGSRKIKKMNVM